MRTAAGLMSSMQTAQPLTVALIPLAALLGLTRHTLLYRLKKYTITDAGS